MPFWRGSFPLGKMRRQSVAWPILFSRGTLIANRLLYMANLHFCAPLWFVRLKKDGVLPICCRWICKYYLQYLHQANVERQDAFLAGRPEIVTKLRDLEVPVILLKGAATLCDDLYQDAGARMMGDLDFLVKTQHIEPVKNLLWQLGYDQQADCFGTSGFFDSNRPHHLPRYLKPGHPRPWKFIFKPPRVRPIECCQPT